MLQEKLEPKWVDTFTEVFERCGVSQGDVAAVLCESQSRPSNVALAEAALHRLGATLFTITLPTPRQSAPVPVRSTGASDAIQGVSQVIGALGASTIVVDCTVEGLLHAKELPAILAGGARVIMVSNEHPEMLERLRPDPQLEPKVKAGIRLLRGAKSMHITSAAGSDLRVGLDGARVGGGWGYTSRPGTITHWPGGLCLAFPAAGSVNGTLVMAPGDINLTFKRYLESAVTLTIEQDYVVDIGGDGLDADLMREHYAAWNDRDTYAVSHVGWGMNPAARWDALTFYDRSQTNGTEQRAFAGNVLYSTGANEVAGRYALGHFDLPMKGCSLSLDGTAVVVNGALQGDVA
ncbi:MAG: peptidase M29 [Chromatiales bacterium]|jgi:2,5-dihydroxypyridine 5,6-dioxygenase|nr:peptidase M29 [Chromatiales bacterium]